MLRALGFGSAAIVAGVAAFKRESSFSARSADAPMKAVCVLNGDGGSGVRGVVTLTQTSPEAPTLIQAKFEGLKPGKHGFHIHEKGNLTQGCLTAGPHYNPFKREHGGPASAADSRHVGDLGNVSADSSGVAVFELNDPLVQLSGQYSVIGRAFVLHADEDDLGLGGHADSKTTGHAGARVACGVIGRDY